MFHARTSIFQFVMGLCIACTLASFQVSAIAQEANKSEKKSKESAKATAKSKSKSESEKKTGKEEKASRKERNKADKATRDRLLAIEKKLDNLVEKLGTLPAKKNAKSAESEPQAQAAKKTGQHENGRQGNPEHKDRTEEPVD